MKNVKDMTAGEINRELDKLDKVFSKLNDTFIAVGRGNERPSELQGKTDPLSLAMLDAFAKNRELQIEIELRYGSRVHRLPRGFGPRYR